MTVLLGNLFYMDKKNERDFYVLKEEYKRFIEACPYQYELFWKVIFNAGLRISEGLLISKNDVLSDENKIIINTLKRKNHPKIPVIISHDLIKEIEQYVLDNNITDRLWNFSRQYAWKIFKSIGKKAGLNPRYSPHSFRHGHGLMIADITNGDVMRIKDRLRHASLKSTEYYLHISEQKQKELSNKIEEYLK